MAQFDVYWLNDGYVVDCQSDWIDEFDTRLVVPLLPASEAPRAVDRLTPSLDVRGEPHVMATPLAGAVLRSLLGQPVVSLARYDLVIKSALDRLITGT